LPPVVGGISAPPVTPVISDDVIFSITESIALKLKLELPALVRGVVDKALDDRQRLVDSNRVVTVPVRVSPVYGGMESAVDVRDTERVRGRKGSSKSKKGVDSGECFVGEPKKDCFNIGVVDVAGEGDVGKRRRTRMKYTKRSLQVSEKWQTQSRSSDEIDLVVSGSVEQKKKKKKKKSVLSSCWKGKRSRRRSDGDDYPRTEHERESPVVVAARVLREEDNIRGERGSGGAENPRAERSDVDVQEEYGDWVWNGVEWMLRYSRQISLTDAESWFQSVRSNVGGYLLDIRPAYSLLLVDDFMRKQSCLARKCGMPEASNMKG
jgi:hypothetical protein